MWLLPETQENLLPVKTPSIKLTCTYLDTEWVGSKAHLNAGKVGSEVIYMYMYMASTLGGLGVEQLMEKQWGTKTTSATNK